MAIVATVALASAFGLSKTETVYAGTEASTDDVESGNPGSTTQTTTTDTVTVTYDLDSESILAKKGEQKYLFYTTDKATKKVPAANKWSRVPDTGVDCKTLASAKTFYFAMTTSPDLDDIVAATVPARQKLTKAVYDPVKNKWTVMSGATDVESIALVPDENMIQSLQFSGGTTFVHIKALDAEGNAVISTDDDKDQISLALNSTTKVYTFPEKAARASVDKAVKIAKRAAGPSVTVDYANHCIKVSKTAEVGEVKDISTEANYTDDKKIPGKTVGNNTFYFFDDDAKVYNVRTAKTEKKIASLDTVLDIKQTEAFSANASIIGGFESDAYLEIVPTDTPEKGKSVSYQYAVVGKALYEELIQDKKFNYTAAIDSNGKSRIVWKSLKYAVDKNGKVAPAKATIKNSKNSKLADGSVVLVREAATANTPSSKVMIFEMPKSETPYWLSKRIDEDDNQKAGNISIADVNIAEKEATIEVIINNGDNKLVDGDKLIDFVKVNKVAPSKVEESVISDSQNIKLTITVPDTLKLDSKDITVELKAGFIKSSTYTYSEKLVKADTLAPKIVTDSPKAVWSVEGESTTAKVVVEVELSEDLATKDGSGKFVALTDGQEVTGVFTKGTSSEKYTLSKVTYKKAAGRTKAKLVFELKYDFSQTNSAAGIIVYVDNEKLYDLVGHALPLNSDKIDITADDKIKAPTQES